MAVFELKINTKKKLGNKYYEVRDVVHGDWDVLFSSRFASASLSRATVVLVPKTVHGDWGFTTIGRFWIAFVGDCGSLLFSKAASVSRLGDSRFSIQHPRSHLSLIYFTRLKYESQL
mmetsp:Transcript_11838/g.26279  ORF Transcript_11838/g.26279 Transcript_11838/m.26279 type:complete len:117 (+) Transcript_11838:3633-3983(+)